MNTCVRHASEGARAVIRTLAVAPLLILGMLAIPGVSGAAPSQGAGRPDSYIVVLKDGADPGEAAREHARRVGAEVRHVYRAALNGYAARLPAGRVAELRADPRVAHVEADGAVAATAQVLPWGINRIDADVSSTLAGNNSGSVGTANGYIIDTGIHYPHSDLNVVAHGNWTGDGKNYDCNSHGTHVAGTVGARDNGDQVGAAPGMALIGRVGQRPSKLVTLGRAPA
jgi:subtilisin